MNYKHRFTSGLRMKVLNHEIPKRKHSGVFNCELISEPGERFRTKSFKVSKEMLNKDWIKED